MCDKCGQEGNNCCNEKRISVAGKKGDSGPRGPQGARGEKGDTGGEGIWGIADSSGHYTYYATYPLARAASVYGQCIELFADVSTTGSSYIFKDGVNIDLHGHTIDFTGSSDIAFIDNGVKCVMVVSGQGVISKSQTEDSIYTILITNVESEIGMFSKVINSGGGSGGGIACAGTIYGAYIYAGQGVSTGEQSVVYNCTINAFGNNVSALDINGKAINCIINYTGQFGHAVTGNSRTDSIRISRCDIQSSLSPGILITSQCKIIENLISCTWDNAGGHGVDAAANNIISGNTIIVKNAGAYAIHSAVTPQVFFSGNVVKGTSNLASAGIVQGQTNVPDSVGNIILN